MRAHHEFLAMVRSPELAADDRLRRDVILGQTCNGVLRKASIESAHGIAFDETIARELGELAALADDGLVLLERYAIRLAPLDQMFLRNVALPFDRYFRERKAKGEDAKPTFSKTLRRARSRETLRLPPAAQSARGRPEGRPRAEIRR